MASKYNYIDHNVNFTGIKDVQIFTGQKISCGQYNVDANGNITKTKPVINAIDIDWNNATIEGLDTISTSGDLIYILSTLHNTLTNLHIPHSIIELEGGTKVLTTDNFEVIKEELRGKSAYEIAKSTAEAQGIYFPYETEAQWIASLKGEKGRTGDAGQNGLSAYEIAKYLNPSIGTQEEWIQSLQGKSAYQIAYEQDSSIGNSIEWIKSLKGKSAYETAKEVYAILGKEFPYENEVEWMAAINAGNEVLTTIDEKINPIQDAYNNLIEQLQLTDNKNIKEIIDEEVQKLLIPENANESLNTIEEVSNWIQNRGAETSEIVTSLTQLKNEWDDNKDTFATKGELYDGEGNLKTIKGGTNYATTLEEVNELFKEISYAKDVEDGAEQNWITGITIPNQDILVNDKNVIYNDNSEVAPLIHGDYNSTTRTLDLSLDKENIESILNTVLTESVNESKSYTDKKLSWKIM